MYQKEVGFSSFCALVFCILLNYPRFDGIYQYVDSSIMLELYTLKCVQCKSLFIFHTFYTLRKKVKEKLVFEGKKKSDQVKDKYKK